MSEPTDDLPQEIIERILSFCTEDANGYQHVKDRHGLVDFIVENVERYPALSNLVKVDEEAMTRHMQDTGEVPAGVKLIKTTTEEGSNVTRVQIVHGPGQVEPD